MIVRAALYQAPRTVRIRFARRPVLASSTCPLFKPATNISHDASFAVRSLWTSSRSADEVMEDLQELYATAKDEFEIAAEETEKKTVYASADRDAARDALKELKDTYEKALKLSDPQVADDIRGRVSQRIRELENAFTALEESAQAD